MAHTNETSITNKSASKTTGISKRKTAKSKGVAGKDDATAVNENDNTAPLAPPNAKSSTLTKKALVDKNMNLEKELAEMKGTTHLFHGGCCAN
jgi:hypothetical protein